MSTNGVFCVHRGVFRHPMFDADPYSRRDAWLWLLGNAVWKETRVRFNGRMMTLQRGQLVHSSRFLAAKWKWSRGKTLIFLNALKNESMIETLTSHRETVITICKYDEYQFGGDEPEPPTVPPTVPPKDHRKTTDCTKEEEVKKDKKIDSVAVDFFFEFAAAIGVKPDDPTLFGFQHNLTALRSLGFRDETIIAGGVNAMRGKSKPPAWAYFAKCIESENEQRASPAKPEIRNGAKNADASKSGLAAIDRIFAGQHGVPAIENEDAVLSLPARPVQRP